MFQLPYEILIGLRYTRAKRRNNYISFISLSSMLVIALGVMALIVVMSVMNGFQHELRSRILGVASHVQVLADYEEKLSNWQQVADISKKRPGVVAAAPFIDAQAMLSYHGKVRGVLVRGIVPDLENKVATFDQHLLAGNFANLQPGTYNLMIGSDLARHLGVDVGDKISLMAPQAQLSVAGVIPRIKLFTIGGIFHLDMHEYDSSLVLMSLEDSQVLYQYADLVSGVRLKISDVFAAPKIAAELAKVLPVNGRITDWTKSHANFFRALKIEKTVMFIILSLIIMVAAGNLVSSLVMAVTDKEADIAILRTLGASPQSIMLIFIVQGVVIGVVGLILGVVSGVSLALNIDTVVPALEQVLGLKFLASDIYFISDLPSELYWSDVLMIATVSLTLSILATLYPSYRAAKLNPVEALRYE